MQGNQEAIIISQEYNGNNALVFYIAVYGSIVSSTYSFNVYADTKENSKIQLNEIIKGSIMQDEILNFKFIIQGESPRNITVEHKENVGDTAIILKSCGGTRFSSSCQVSR